MNNNQKHHIATAQNKTSNLRRNTPTASEPNRFLVNETPVNVRYGNDGTLQEIITGMVFSNYIGKNDLTMLQ